jgi:6-pyruvoyltetrahydropterin/6-carboxytetrahydropterin synthase
MFQVGTAITFPAQHIMPGQPGPEGQLHEHQYRLEVVIEREKLDDRGMVCDLDVLDAVLGRIDSTVRDQNLEIIRPSDAEAVTVEVFAKWAHDTIAAELRGGGADVLAVRVYENPVAFGGFSDRLD